MTSVLHYNNQIPMNKLYINFTAIQSTIVDSNNNVVPWVVSPVAGGLSTAGAAVLRDMGRNLYIPDPNLATSVGSQSTILRRVQLVPTGTNGYYGTGDVAAALAGTETDFLCGYIRLGAQTYAGGTGIPTGVVRLN